MIFPLLTTPRTFDDGFEALVIVVVPAASAILDNKVCSNSPVQWANETNSLNVSNSSASELRPVVQSGDGCTDAAVEGECLLLDVGTQR